MTTGLCSALPPPSPSDLRMSHHQAILQVFQQLCAQLVQEEQQKPPLAPEYGPQQNAQQQLQRLAFGFGWTPCVGPALAAILMVASGMGDLWKGGLLLLVYGLSMTLPFVVAALFAKPFLAWVGRNRKYLGHVEKLMGAMLVLFAILIATNSVNYIADFMIRHFDWSGTLK